MEIYSCDHKLSIPLFTHNWPPKNRWFPSDGLNLNWKLVAEIDERKYPHFLLRRWRRWRRRRHHNGHRTEKNTWRYRFKRSATTCRSVWHIIFIIVEYCGWRDDIGPIDQIKYICDFYQPKMRQPHDRISNIALGRRRRFFFFLFFCSFGPTNRFPPLGSVYVYCTHRWRCTAWNPKRGCVFLLFIFFFFFLLCPSCAMRIVPASRSMCCFIFSSSLFLPMA